MLASATSAQALTTQWTLRAVPVPGGAKEGRLAGVSCTSSSACTTVGNYKNFFGVKNALVERWNGEKWTIQTVPISELTEASLSSVSCATATFCVAVGTEKSGSNKPVAAHWNGTTWSVQTPPNPEKTEEASLSGVTCTSTSACIAVGTYKTGGVIKPLAEHWNGTKWEAKLPPEKGTEGVLSGVACNTSTACTAVGHYKSAGVTQPLAERWNGAAWAAQTPVEKGTEAKLEAVACPTANICMASGFYKSAGVKLTLTQRWNGVAWEVLSSPNPESSQGASLGGIACSSLNGCLATGTYILAEAGKTLGERWDGVKWALDMPITPPGAAGPEVSLPGTACPSTTYCMTVGYYKNGVSAVGPLAESVVRVKTPSNTSLPTISPSAPKTGSIETATTGTWTEEPTSYAYQWRRCNASGLECVDIVGATASTYYPLAADVGKTLVVKVTATNIDGSASASSNPTELVTKAGVVTEYALPPNSEPLGIAPGPDGNLWFTNCGTNKVGKITTEGAITEYNVAPFGGTCPISITKGPDGNLWFVYASSQKKMGKITTGGTGTSYELSVGMNNGRDITVGPDGNLWFASTEGNVAKMTTAGAFTPYSAGFGEPTGITNGPDGNLWLTGNSSSKVAKMTTAGAVTEYSLPANSRPWGIDAGPDGNLWFGVAGKIGKITTAGTITEYSLLTSGDVKGIVEGPDGLMWFAHGGADKVGKITTGGTATEYALPPGANPRSVAAGSDGNIWFTLNGTDRIGMISP